MYLLETRFSNEIDNFIPSIINFCKLLYVRFDECFYSCECKLTIKIVWFVILAFMRTCVICYVPNKNIEKKVHDEG